MRRRVPTTPSLFDDTVLKGRGAEPEEPEVVSVSVLSGRLARGVERITTGTHVLGEVASVQDSPAGHRFFSLKDDQQDASLSCVMYRSAPVRSRAAIALGARVIVVGHASVYVPRGRLQLVAKSARPAGRGAQLEAFERLKRSLQQEGLFDVARKKALPPDPRRVGLVTSSRGAALHDVAQVAFRRGGAQLLLAPATVQGPDAPRSICAALERLAQVDDVDVIILTRGGGAVDDLAAFNHEEVVRTISRMHPVVVSAVGHETDISLADLVADVRAATPSQAAELVVPDAGARHVRVLHLERRLARAVGAVLMQREQSLDRAVGRLRSSWMDVGTRARGRIAKAERRVHRRHPSAVLSQSSQRVTELTHRLRGAIRGRLGQEATRISREAARLDTLSPLAVLHRGYAIALSPNGQALRSADEAEIDMPLRIRLHRGEIRARVERVDVGLPADPPSEVVENE